MDPPKLPVFSAAARSAASAHFTAGVQLPILVPMISSPDTPQPTTASTTAPASPPRYRRAADITAFRLGRAILGYLAVVTLIITLAPFRFATAPVHGLTEIWTWSDIVMNIVMFVPIGFVYQLTRPAGSPVRWLQVVLLGAVLSSSIEIAQLFESTRYTSWVDVVTNTSGALLGAWMYGVALRRIEGSSTVRTLALELPLMGLVYLLIPLMWLAGLAADGSRRDWLVLPIVAFASGIIGSVYTAYIAPTRSLARGWLLLAVTGWYIVAIVPSAVHAKDLLIGGLIIALSVAWLRSLATTRIRDRADERGTVSRFEVPTLRVVMPLFAAYLACTSLWPLDSAEPTWRFMLALLPTVDATQTEIFVALEHVASFTLVGYIIAEFYGRDNAHYAQVAPRVIAWGGGISLLLEVVRGFHPAYQASALMLVLTVGAAVFGGWLYQLQRDHVRTLLQRRTPRSATHSAAASDDDAAVVTSNDPGEPALSGL